MYAMRSTSVQYDRAGAACKNIGDEQMIEGEMIVEPSDVYLRETNTQCCN